MKRKLLCAVLLGLVFLTGCKKDSSDVDTVSSVKTDDAVLISVLEKYPKVDFASEDEIETIYISDQAAEWKKDFDTSDYENYDENYEEFCELMDEFMETELEAGRITSYTQNDYAYLVTFESGEMTGYTIPSPEGCLAGDGGGINTIVTIWPGIEDFTAKNACGAKEAMGHVAANYEVNMQSSYEFGFYSEPENILEPWLNIEKGDIIIFESHGSYVSPDYKKYGDYRLVDGPSLCIGQKICKQDLLDYLNTNGLGECLSGMIMYDEKTRNGKIYGDVYLPWGFFDIYYEPGDLEGTVFYLGSCASMGDDKLASTLCNLGAEVVIGWDGKSYSHYERDACEHLFKLLAEGENVTNAISLTYDEYYWDYHASVHGGSRLIHGAWAEMCCYPEGSTLTLDDLYGKKETAKPKAEQPAVQEPETLSPEDLANIDYSQMKETYLGDVTLIYDDSYNESVSVGKVPNYSIYLEELDDIFPDYPSLSSADMANYDAHPEFLMDGVIVPLVHFRSDRYITEVTEANQFVFDNATQQQYDEFFGLHSWGLLPNMPEAFREPLEEIMNWAIKEYWIEKEELIGLAMKGTEDYEYIDEKGREVFGFDMGNSTYYDGQRIIETDEYNLHACISIGFDYTYPYNEHPYNEDIYFSIETENGIQHYKMEMVGLGTTQTSELNRIAYEENRFAKALEYWHAFNNYFGMEVELYQLSE